MKREENMRTRNIETRDESEYKWEDLYVNELYLKQNSSDKGVVIAHHSIKKNTKTNEKIEDIISWKRYMFVMDENKRTENGEVWIYDDVLDRLLKEGVEDVSIYTKYKGPFDFTARQFLEYG